MSGKELYDSLSKRDYSNSQMDKYAQLLSTLFHHIFLNGQAESFFKLLEKAEKLNKKLAVRDNSVDEYFMDNIILV